MKPKSSVWSISMVCLRDDVPLRLGQKTQEMLQRVRSGMVLPGAALAWSFFLGTKKCFSEEQAAKGGRGHRANLEMLTLEENEVRIFRQDSWGKEV